MGADAEFERRSSLERRAAVYHALGDPRRLAIVDALRLSDRSPSELAELTGLPSNLVAFHLDVLMDAEVVARTTSEGDARRRYVRLRAATLTSLDHSATSALRPDGDGDVLFVCTANSARSQLAAALWARTTGLPARSAGRSPATAVHPLAIEVARGRGLEISGTPHGYAELHEAPALVVSVCDRAREAGIPFDVPMLHWSVPDPVVGDRRHFEAAFDELAVRIEALAAAYAAAA